MFTFKEKQVSATSIKVGDAVKDASQSYFHIVKSVSVENDVVNLVVSMGFTASVKPTSMLTILDHS